MEIESNGSPKLRIGLAPWPKMRPECFGQLHNIHCDPGYELLILDILLHLMNVRYEIKYAQNFGCGFRTDASGNWTGLMKMLYDNEVDVVGNLCKLEADRRNQTWLKYSRPILQDRQGFLTRVPDKLYVFFIAAPFTETVWCLILLIILIFIVVFALIYIQSTSGRLEKHRAILMALSDAANILSGTDFSPINKTWFYLECFFGFVTVLYSTFIAAVLLTPVGRPFNDHSELSDQLISGKYRLLDFKEHPRSIICYDQMTCLKLRKAIEQYGFRYFQQPAGAEGTNLLLNQLLLNQEKLVLVKGVFDLKFYLSSFVDRNRLWLITDEFSGGEWSVFFYRSDFQFAEQFDQALIKMSGGVEGIIKKYFGLAHQVVQARNIKEKISKRISFNAGLLLGPLKAYAIGISFSISVFAAEISLKRCLSFPNYR